MLSAIDICVFSYNNFIVDSSISIHNFIETHYRKVSKLLLKRNTNKCVADIRQIDMFSNRLKFIRSFETNEILCNRESKCWASGPAVRWMVWSWQLASTFQRGTAAKGDMQLASARIVLRGRDFRANLATSAQVPDNGCKRICSDKCRVMCT